MVGKNEKGVTIVELMVTIVISSILAIGMVRLFADFGRNNVSIQRDIVLQERVQRLNQFLERDLRVAGLNLPGNGLLIDSSSGPACITIKIFTNDANRQTVLTEEINLVDDTIVKVPSACGAVAKDFVCMYDSVGTPRYCYIKEVRPGAGGTEEVVITDQNFSKTFQTANTRVYFAKCIEYNLEIDPNKTTNKYVVRRYGGKMFVLNHNNEVSTMQFVARNANNELVNDNLSQARTLTVNILNKLSDAEAKIISTIAVAIRNYQ